MDHRFLIPMMGIIYGNIIFSVIHYYLNESNTKDLHQSLSFIIMRLKKQLIDKELKIFKPMPAPIDKIQNKYRWRMIIKGNMDETINLAINECLKDVYDKDVKGIRIAVDVNPNNMM